MGNKQSTMGNKPSKTSKEGKVPNATVSEIGPDVENGGSGEHLIGSGVVEQHEGVKIVEDQEKNLSRSLSQRHIQVGVLRASPPQTCPCPLVAQSL